MVTIIWSVTAGHGPVGSLDVKVSVTVPEVALGVYVEFKRFALLKVPEGADHVPVVAAPPTTPARVIVPPGQTD
jgi:hypothetical protein